MAVPMPRPTAELLRVAFAILVVTVVCARCGGSPPAPSGSDVITGVERFGWDQPAADAGELASFRYAIYVDDVRGEASGIACASSQTDGRFTCTSNLPSMPSGAHTLQVAAFVLDAGVVRESARSASVRVVKR
jgi:hypothetical protein